MRRSVPVFDLVLGTEYVARASQGVSEWNYWTTKPGNSIGLVYKTREILMNCFNDAQPIGGPGTLVQLSS